MDNRQIRQMIADKMLPDAGNKPTLIETHISWVILGNRYAYKIKKPVKYSFLDFSTFYKRRKYCELEVELNKRLAPSMYFDVVPVIESNNKCRIGGEGIVVDFAVRMKRMQNGRRLDIRLERNKVSNEEISELARIIANFHRRQEPINTSSDVNEMAEAFNDIQSVAPFFYSSNGKESTRIIESAIKSSDNYLKLNRSFLVSRIENGFIRDVHGDLHSANIFMYASPIVFDCIEFNEAFRQIDVLNEAAFFCMDMDMQGRPDFGQIFLDKYLILTGFSFTQEEKALLHYYKIYRANIKAKVNALKSIQAGDLMDGLEQKRRADIALGYLGLLNKYLLEVVI